MAKKKNPDHDSTHYEYVRCIVYSVEEDQAEVRFEYKLTGNAVAGNQTQDEYVTGWSDKDIKDLARQLLDVDKDDPVDIEVVYN